VHNVQRHNVFVEAWPGVVNFVFYDNSCLLVFIRGTSEPLTIQAANAGKHVMVEKPLDITLDIQKAGDNNLRDEPIAQFGPDKI